MSTSEIETMIRDMNAEMQDMKQRYQARMKEVFQQAFKQYFDSNPEVTCFMWRQYTPYFNDGDACVFTCFIGYGAATNAVDFREARYGDYDGDQEGVWIDDPDYGDFNQSDIPSSVQQSTESLRQLLSSVDDRVMLEMFGDHVIVYATPKGFEVDEYDHD